ncbi:MAG: single-stranded-DNA-specific exonuclease RecJ [Lachnospiraceae bacterium]|nr:single-stranded-DNA-specific exonuclease RecJ [Lachnospiraceae bacterium]
MGEWVLKCIAADYKTLSEKYGLDPVILRIMRNRGIETPEDVESFLYGNPEIIDMTEGFLDLDKACELLLQARKNGRKLRVIGDYDVDGACSTAILIKGFKAFGIQADYRIPHRMKDGYGLNRSLIEQAKEDGIEVIVTCDNGISALDAVTLAKSYGMTVIVTDHHEVMKDSETGKEILPSADAVINPKRSGNHIPYQEICGAYVAYKLISRLLGFHKKDASDIALREELAELASFATVGDVMPLCRENRVLVKYGLSLMENSRNVGIRELIHQSELAGKKIQTYHIGFVLGPCINASGRLDTAERALELLLSDDVTRVKAIASELKKMNEIRKQLTEQGTEEAVRIVESSDIKEDNIIIVYLPDCHESIAGIVASRLKEKYHKPIFVFTNGEEGIKGSGRSVEAYDMYEGISRCSAYFTKFGGHKMAAGISMPKENLELFRRQVNEESGLTEKDLTPIIKIDADMPFAYVTPDLIRQMEVLEPFGDGNPKPVFARKDMVLYGGTIMGAKRKAAVFYVKDGVGRKFELKYFGDLDRFHAYLDEKYGQGCSKELYRGKEVPLAIAYVPEFNTYNGITRMQFRMLHYK